MSKKTDKNILKDQIKDTEVFVRQARRSFDDVFCFAVGAITSLKAQKNITEEMQECMESYLRRLDTQSKKIEIEYYKLKNIAEEGLK